MSRRLLSEQDLEALSIGAALLGTGGGGNPYIGKLRTRELLRMGKQVEIVSLDELAPDALVVSVGGIGAPVVGIEKIEKGDECYQALLALEEDVGKPISAIIPAEIGGSNSIEPMIAAALAGIPVVDADGMGRAFPEVQMCTFFIYGHPTEPSALADEKGNRVIIKNVKDMYWLEGIARAITVQMGATAGYALPPMRADFLQRYAVPDTITQALNIGHTVLEARAARRDPIEAVLKREKGIRLIEGKITDVRRELKGGFAVGKAKLEGSGAYHGQQAEIDIQNEYLIFRRDGVAEVVVPDLIMVVESDSGEPITTEVLRYGQRVTVVALPCHPLMNSPEALKVIGPAAFGYDDVTYTPFIHTIPNRRTFPCD